MKLTDLIQIWVTETYKSGTVQLLPHWDDEDDIYILGFPHGKIFPTFVVISSTSIYYDQHVSGNEYISAVDPRLFEKLKSYLDIAVHYRTAWVAEVNEDEAEMIFSEETYFLGGYAT